MIVFMHIRTYTSSYTFMIIYIHRHTYTNNYTFRQYDYSYIHVHCRCVWTYTVMSVRHTEYAIYIELCIYVCL